MKRVRCPKCKKFLTFDETKYQDGQRLDFECPSCGKQFGIRIGVSKAKKMAQTEQKKNRKRKQKASMAPYTSLKTCSITSILSRYKWAITSLDDT